jgi:hypothetical protein
MIFVNILFVYPNLSVIQKSDQSTLGSEVNLRQKFIYFPTANHIRDHSFCGWFVMIVLGFWLIILENKNLIYKKKKTALKIYLDWVDVERKSQIFDPAKNRYKGKLTMKSDHFYWQSAVKNNARGLLRIK